jgi:hypothetical protein
VKLKDRPHWYASYAKTYLLAAEALWSNEQVNELPLIFPGPITQLLGHAAELTLKAHLLLHEYTEADFKGRYRHQIPKLAQELSTKSDILDRVERHVSTHKSIINVPVPEKHAKHLVSQGKRLENWYSFRLHLLTMSASYNKEPANGDEYSSRYPPRNDFFRVYYHMIIAVGLEFLLSEIDCKGAK